MTQRHLKTRWAWIGLCAATLGASAAGCGSTEDVPLDFESDDPNPNASTRGASSSGGADASAGAPSGKEDSNASAERAVQEADIIQRAGSRLYALSRYGGLSIIDISARDQMRMLGRYRMNATPFEMYVQDGVVQIMLNDFGHWVSEGDSPYGAWVQSSEVLTLDATNPGNIRKLASFDVPGSISDSRMVGDVLYLVTHEDGYCWRCDRSQNTTVTSFKTSPNAISQVDQLRFASTRNGYSYWKRSVAANNQRLFIGGPEWNWSGSGPQHSVIQVVDISNPSGVLRKGADVSVDGQINSRWQMDEHQGVLRVVSQRGNGWGNGIDPEVETFSITNSDTITPLGRTNLKLRKPESLRSVRFDGTRAYAITAERTDPLFTIDLSNPANPKQLGELEIPGWVYHMEPRGDRMVAIGFDNDNGEGSLNVSLFDVSNLSTPRMIKRVNFAKGWGNLPEDQDRIHKSFQVLDDAGMILVPFSSYSWRGRDSDGNCVAPQSGIQLIDYSRDNLSLRGVAPQLGQPRRAFLYNDRLFAVSDRNVTSFRYENRDAPAKAAEFSLANPAYTIATTPSGLVAQLTNDWWTGEAELALTPRAQADLAEPVGKIRLSALAPASASACGPGAWTNWYQARLFSHGNFVYVVVPTNAYAYGPYGGNSSRTMLLGAIDVSNPASPRLASRLEVSLPSETNGWHYGGFFDGYAYYSGGYYGSLVGAGQAVVANGSTLAFIDSVVVPSNEPYDITDPNARPPQPTVTRAVYTVDFANPAAPVSTKTDLPSSLGTTPLILQGNTIYTSRWETGSIPGRVRFFADRIDIRNPRAPALLSSVNIPGSLLTVDGARLAAVDYRRTVSPALDWSDCYGSGRSMFDADSKQCITIERNLKTAELVGNRARLRGTTDLAGQNVGGILAAEDKVYVTLYPEYDYTGVSTSGGGYQPPKLRPGSKSGLFVYGGLRSGGALSLRGALEGPSRWPLAATGSRIAVASESGLSVYDTTGSVPRRVGGATLRGWGYSYDVLLDNNSALCALGEWGMQDVALAP